MKALQQYLELYEQYRMMLDQSAEMLNTQRPRAYELLRQYGLPTRRTEDYKYTDVETPLSHNYGLNLQRTPLRIDPEKTFQCAVKGLQTHVFYIVNDTITTAPTLLLTDEEEAHQVVVARIHDFAQLTTPDGLNGATLLQQHYNRLAQEQYDAMTTLNTMLVQDALVVYVPQHTHLERPLQIVNIAASTVEMMMNRRLLVIMGEDSSATLLSCEEHPAGVATLSLQTTEIIAQKGATLHYYSLEETNEENTRFNQCYIEALDHATVETGEMTLHNGTTRNTMVVRLRGTDARVNTYGAVIADREQHTDNHILVDHAVSDCNSNMLYKYVLDGKSIGAFAGKVLVREGAQKSLSEQTNANLCIGPMAHAYSQPMLEIYADDVKCNHGSTIGKLDENALFYMRQRGIPQKEAELLLQHAFINEVLRSISVEQLREHLSLKIEERFRNKDAQCEGCKMLGHCK